MADSKRQVELQLLIKQAGAAETAAEIKKLATTTTTVQQELSKIGRGDQIQRIGTEMGLLAKKTRDTAAAAKELSKQLESIGANKDEIASATGAFNAAQSGGSNRLARAGSELRALPSTQTGLGFGTDAIGNVLRLSGALTEIAGKSSVATAAINILTPRLGAQAAATIGAAAPAAAFVVAFGAIAIALSSLTSATSQNAEAITAYAEAQRGLNADIVAGLTTEEAQKKLDDLNESRRLEEELLAKNKAAYAAFEKDATDAGASVDDLGSTLGKIVFGSDVLKDTAKAFSGDEQALADSIAASEKNITTFSASADTLSGALESGRLAANDAAEAEKKLAEERSKAALASADSAAKELQAQQKALGATEEQNKKRLEAITDEEAVAQKQIEVLEASGITSEEVAKKIASLKEQLGLLGKESAFITDTALEASKAADAEKKALKDTEDGAKKAAQAQDQYRKSVESASLSLKNSVQDIGTRLSQTLQDNTLKLNRDLNNLDIKFNQDQQDLQIKANRAEMDAYKDNLDDIAKIRKDAAKDEREALIEGDFQQLYLSRLAREEALKEEQQTDLKEAQGRKQNQDFALEDLKRADSRQRDARRLGYEQQNMDARTSRDRELAQARLAQNRALAQASQALNAELGLRQQFWNAALNQVKQATSAIGASAAGASRTGANANSPFGQFTGPFKAVVRR